MSNDDVLRKRVARLLADTMSLEVPSVDTDLFEDGLLDSLGFVELLANLEREFGVTTSIDGTFSATHRFSSRSKALYTTPMAPWPMSVTSVYRSNRGNLSAGRPKLSPTVSSFSKYRANSEAWSG